VTRIEIGITHEVVINGDKSWIRLSVTDEVPESMDPDPAIDALAVRVNEKLIDVIETTVKTVNDYTPRSKK
jgi:hypothetical protein